MDNKGFGFSLNYEFWNEPNASLSNRSHLIIAGMFSTPSELSSADIEEAAEKIVKELETKGIEAVFAFEYNERPINHENLARYFKLKFENALQTLGISTGNVTVSATTHFKDAADKSNYVTV